MFRLLAIELKRHAPFTFLGATTGIAIMAIILAVNVPPDISNTIFYILHPFHVILSALVTTGMYKLHTRCNFFSAILVGYTGSIGLATVSDAIIPYIGAVLLQIKIPFIIPFIAKWWITPLALVGILMGYLRPTTKYPHAGHVFLSTWASLFYFTAFGRDFWFPLLPLIFIFLFLAVWLPCCGSDIIYPLLFAGSKLGSPKEKY
ncbi:MAG: hypothetical protein AMJ45_01445 [Syntrophobacter sp. DG_60]|nr:MAG: hypothetical protein AMJ45_01445 [Syntrophobacter sp. DG_60]